MPADDVIVCIQPNDTAAKMIVPPAVKADTFGGRAARAWRHSAPAEIWQPKVDVSVVFHQRRLYVEALEHLVNFQALDPQPPVVGLGNPKQPPLQSLRPRTSLVALVTLASLRWPLPLRNIIIILAFGM